MDDTLGLLSSLLCSVARRRLRELSKLWNKRLRKKDSWMKIHSWQTYDQGTNLIMLCAQAKDNSFWMNQSMKLTTKFLITSNLISQTDVSELPKNYRITGNYTSHAQHTITLTPFPYERSYNYDVSTDHLATWVSLTVDCNQYFLVEISFFWWKMRN